MSGIEKAIDRVIMREAAKRVLKDRADKEGGMAKVTPAAARFLLEKARPSAHFLYSIAWQLGFTVNGIPPRFPIAPLSWAYNDAMRRSQEAYMRQVEAMPRHSFVEVP